MSSSEPTELLLVHIYEYWSGRYESVWLPSSAFSAQRGSDREHFLSLGPVAYHSAELFAIRVQTYEIAPRYLGSNLHFSCGYELIQTTVTSQSDKNCLKEQSRYISTMKLTFADWTRGTVHQRRSESLKDEEEVHVALYLPGTSDTCDIHAFGPAGGTYRVQLLQTVRRPTETGEKVVGVTVRIMLPAFPGAGDTQLTITWPRWADKYT